MSLRLIGRRGALAQSGTATLTYAQQILRDNPVAYWRTNEISGITAVDSSGTGSHPGTYTGGYTLGQNGGTLDGDKAVLLNGTSGFIDLGANGIDLTSGDWTMEAFINPTAVASGPYAIFGAAAGGYAMQIDTGRVGIAIQTISGGAPGALVSASVWSLATITWQASIKRLTHFINGAQIGVADNPFGASVPTPGVKTSVIGRGGPAFTNWYGGLLDELAIYLTALSPARIAAHYAAVGTQPLPLPGAITFTGNFESGNDSQWNWGEQCNTVFNQNGTTTSGSDPGPHRGDIYIGDAAKQGKAPAQGNYAARFDLPIYAGPNASEVLRKRDPSVGGVFGQGGFDYYGICLRFPAGWVEPSSTFWGCLVQQMNYCAFAGPPCGLFAHADRLTLVLQTGFVSTAGASTYSSNNGGNTGSISPAVELNAIPPSRWALDVWHQLVIYIKWTTGNDGAWKVWHRQQGTGGAWTQTVNYAPGTIPSLQWTAAVPVTALPSYTSSDKIGAYRGAAAATTSVWHDGYVVGSDFATVAAQLPA